MNILEKTDRGTPSFEEGWEYLCRKDRQNTLIRAAYDGTSTYNLVATILFDRTGLVQDPRWYLDRPSRYVLRGPEGGIDAVMVVIRLPEFGQELDFESYVAVEAENCGAYQSMLRHCIRFERLELVLFRPEHESWVSGFLSTRNAAVHNWTVFGCAGNKDAAALDPEVVAEAHTAGDPGAVDWVDMGGRGRIVDVSGNSTGPADLGNFVLKESVSGIELSFRYYCRGNWEIRELRPLPDVHDHHLAVRLIETGTSRVLNGGAAVLWRLRKEEALRHSAFIEAAGLAIWANEKHLHIACPTPGEPA
jgi:hypothetical protein